jgi:hypothetical protein
MGIPVFGGVAYRSKQVLTRLRELKLVNTPHLTPDGYAVLAADLGGPARDAPGVVVDGKPVAMPATEPCLVPLAADTAAEDGTNVPGGDLMHARFVDRSGRKQIEVRRVEIPIDALGDLERLVEYDHLPAHRKNYDVYPRGHKLA